MFSWITSRFTIDKSGANTAAIDSVKADACVDILMRQKKVPQQHRRTGPPGDQADHPVDAGLQVILERQDHHRRYRRRERARVYASLNRARHGHNDSHL